MIPGQVVPCRQPDKHRIAGADFSMLQIGTSSRTPPRPRKLAGRLKFRLGATGYFRFCRAKATTPTPISDSVVGSGMAVAVGVPFPQSAST